MTSGETNDAGGKLVSGVTAALGKLYAGPVAAVARRLRLNDCYWWVMSRFVGGTHTHEIAGASATFRTASVSETRQVVNLSNETAVVENLLEALDPSDVFHDVGANIGIYSLLAADKLDAGQVVAFEPHPPTADRLRENAGLSGRGVDVRELALSTESGEGFLSIPTDRAGVLYGEVDPDGEVPIRLERGDALDGPSPTVIKVDVEGAELDVLRGYGDAIDDVRLVYAETHGNEDDLLSFFEGAGFSTEVVDERADQKYIKASR